jgi:hypothetical protein
VEVNPINMRDAGEIERAIAAFAGSPNGGLILTAGAMASASRSDHRTGGSAQAPRGLSVPTHHHRRRPDLLRA